MATTRASVFSKPMGLNAFRMAWHPRRSGFMRIRFRRSAALNRLRTKRPQTRHLPGGDVRQQAILVGKPAVKSGVTDTGGTTDPLDQFQKMPRETRQANAAQTSSGIRRMFARFPPSGMRKSVRRSGRPPSAPSRRRACTAVPCPSYRPPCGLDIRTIRSMIGVSEPGNARTRKDGSLVPWPVSTQSYPAAA